MHSTTIRAGEVYGPNYDPTPEAAKHGIQIVHDLDADDAGEWHPESRTIRVRTSDRSHFRSTATYQLAYALDPGATRESAVAFAMSRLVDSEDLAELATVTNDPTLLAKILRVTPGLLRTHLEINVGSRVAVG
ncbi:hypothetical protein [Microbacterium trichothecenolyticum]|uniref:Uncharacterized protein n=1 Tax=Microbacterium trichothecenolyticum TaxID=69370 RepID=A0ABU0TTC9_MICTR|nr:hypothetical protein [Microbacterium trichothecenolyticum]MDQ1122239.1 hypothetical protein [Microbacterium trichothecenolyticum]